MTLLLTKKVFPLSLDAWLRMTPIYASISFVLKCLFPQVPVRVLKPGLPLNRLPSPGFTRQNIQQCLEDEL
jgi:hypothetical protein